MPDDSTHLHLPYIAANQAQKHVTHNEAIRLLDALVQMAVKSRTLTAPPATPADGDRYIVAAGATGVWAGWNLNIAYYVDGAWMKLVPQAGWLAWVDDETAHVRWNGTAWGLMPSGGTSSQVLKGDGTWGTASTASIANNAVTNTKLADMANGTFKGRSSAGSGDPEDLTGAQVAALLEIVKRVTGASGAAGPDITFQALDADAAAITVTTLTEVMRTTGLGAGTWAFKYMIRYQSAASTTGLSTAVDHTGTISAFVSHSRHITTGGAAATGVGDGAAATVAGQLLEGKAERIKDTASSATAGVDTANADMLMVLEGIVVVTASGDLVLKVASEVASSGITIKAGTLLDLRKIA